MARILKKYPEFIIEPENFDAHIDFSEIFGRKAPLHIEVGSGKGTFLVSQARAQPDINFIGIEWARKYYRHAVDRIGRWSLTNVRLLRTDAADFIAQHVPDTCIACYHIYYPDPWPKKRHNKRRLISTANIEHFIRTLQPGGVMQLATDHDDYFEQMKEVVGSRSDILEPIEFTRAAGALDGEVVGTNFERKYFPENRGTHTLAVRKTV